MARLRVAAEIFSAFPELVLGVVVAHGIDNGTGNAEAEASLRAAEQAVRQRFARLTVSEHASIKPWRLAYRRFGAKPKNTPSSIESLVQRVAKGHALGTVNTLVDLYNAVSLRHLLPVGGEDLDRIEGDLVLTFAGPAEPPVRLLGESEPRPPHPGEVIYRDDVAAVCRRWNWKEADRTKLTLSTRNGIFVIEGLPPAGPAEVQAAVKDLADGIRRLTGASLALALLDRERGEVSLDPPRL
jgi:DNA/RNA-binding domain of Phe-tRNA-synthetase-like protein